MTKIEREMRRRDRRRLERLNREDTALARAAAGVVTTLAVLVGAGVLLWASAKQAEEVQAAVLRSHRITDGPLYSGVMEVEPLPDLLPADGEPPQAIEVRAAAAVEEVPAERWESIGNYKLTFYCPCRKCSGKWGRQTKSGATCQENLTVAVDPAVIPLGTHLMINGQEYIAQDVGGGVDGKHIDIFMESHSECLKNGIQRAEVFAKR